MTAVAFSNLDRVLWPAAGFTKGDMVDYYRAVAPVLVPHLAGRPLTLRRFPEGVEGPSWYQNECRGRPDWLRTRAVRDRRGRVWSFCVVDDPRSLLWVVNLGTVELHPLNDPATLVLDLDPGPPADVVDCCRVALRLRDLLADRGLGGFPKTSGSVGLHVYVPLADGDAREVARSLGERLAGVVLDRHADRTGRVLLDWLQNDPLCSTVAPYSLRGTGWPTVSTPVTWQEVERAAETGRPELLTFDAPAVLERVARLGDLFAPVLSRSPLSDPSPR